MPKIRCFTAIVFMIINSFFFTERMDKPMPFTIVYLSDLHHSYMLSVDDFNAMVDWIVDNQESKNIKAVVMSGDIGDERTVGGLETSLQSARSILGKLIDANIPLVIAPGNHDYDNGLNIDRSTTLFNTYLGVDMYSGKEWYGGSLEGNIENTYITFNHQGKDYLVMALEFSPRDKALNWANQVIEQHPNHKVIITTHSYLDNAGLRVGVKKSEKANYPGVSIAPGEEYSNEGEEVWHKLIKLHPNIMSVHSGHWINLPTMAYQVSEGINGNLVYEFFNNWQNIIFDENGSGVINSYPNGTARASLIRLFEYTDNAVKIENYVPSLNIEGEQSFPICFPYTLKSLLDIRNPLITTEEGLKRINAIMLNNGRKTSKIKLVTE